MQQKQIVAQIWSRNDNGEEYPYLGKFYSKIGVACNAAKIRNELFDSNQFFVKVFSIEFIEDIEV